MLPADLGSTPLNKKYFAWDKYTDPRDMNQQALRVNQAYTMAPHLAKYHIKSVGCFSCPIACYTLISVPGRGTGALSCTQFFYGWVGNRDGTTFHANQLANRLGINTFEMIPMIQFVCYLQDTTFGGRPIVQHMVDLGMVPEKIKKDLDDLHYPPGGRVGPEAIEALMHMIAYKQGILGQCLSQGFRRAMDMLAQTFTDRKRPDVAAAIMGFRDMEGILNYAEGGNGGRGMSGHYDPRTQGYYWAVNFGMENRDPNRHGLINLTKWSGFDFDRARSMATDIWGREVADNGLSDVHRDPDIPLTWNGSRSAHANAVIARFIHYRGCIKDSLTVCDWVYPVMSSVRKEKGYKGDMSLEHKLVAYVTGEKIDQEELNKRAARIWNLHRLLTALEWGGGEPVNLRQDHDHIPDHFFLPKEKRLLPGFDPLPTVHHLPLERDKFEATKTAYYRVMGWDEATGLPRRATLKALDMMDEIERFEDIGFTLPA